jgi:acetolactate synthase-1/2/3 large subunit
MKSSSHALLSVFEANGIDRVFLVPGESYLGILDALFDFRGIDAVTCRHESGAGFMAVADGRLTGRPGIALVSRGPGASNASIAVHTAQQDAVPMILIVGQVPRADLRREAFQEIDYRRMYGTIAKWVFEVTDPRQLAEAAFKALRVATAGTPGPVVLAVPEDVQQQPVAQPRGCARTCEHKAGHSDRGSIAATPWDGGAPLDGRGRRIRGARGTRGTLFAGRGVADPGRVVVPAPRPVLQPAPALCRRTRAGESGTPDRGLPPERPDTRAGHPLGDITSQGYSFPDLPRPAQTFVHACAGDHMVGLHFAPDFGLVCDAVELARALTPAGPPDIPQARAAWARRLREIFEAHAAWPQRNPEDGIDFAQVVKALREQASPDAIVCVDAGTFAAPVYRHFGFVPPQRLMSPLSGTMGYGTPAAIASQLRFPGRQVICMVGDGGFMMTGNEMIAAVERKLPILFILANNASYASIRIQQELHYPGRTLGTSLFNPDFEQIARAFGMRARRVVRAEEVAGAIESGLAGDGPHFIEVKTSLSVTLPERRC